MRESEALRVRAGWKSWNTPAWCHSESISTTAALSRLARCRERQFGALQKKQRPLSHAAFLDQSVRTGMSFTIDFPSVIDGCLSNFNTTPRGFYDSCISIPQEHCCQNLDEWKHWPFGETTQASGEMGQRFHQITIWSGSEEARRHRTALLPTEARKRKWYYCWQRCGFPAVKFQVKREALTSPLQQS